MYVYVYVCDALYPHDVCIMFIVVISKQQYISCFLTVSTSTAVFSDEAGTCVCVCVTKSSVIECGACTKVAEQVVSIALLYDATQSHWVYEDGIGTKKVV